MREAKKNAITEPEKIYFFLTKNVCIIYTLAESCRTFLIYTYTDKVSRHGKDIFVIVCLKIGAQIVALSGWSFHTIFKIRKTQTQIFQTFRVSLEKSKHL